MPLCFGALGSVLASSAPQRGRIGAGGPDLLSGDPPATVDLVALVVSLARSEPAPGSKQLAPDHVTAERGRKEPLLLFLGAERHDRRNDPGRNPHRRTFNPAGAEFLGDDDLLHRAGGAAPGFGQVRLYPAALRDSDFALLAWNRFERSNFRADLRTKLSVPGRGRCSLRACRSWWLCRRLSGVFRVPTECGDESERAAVVNVGVVFPGESDATVDLNAVLRAVLRGCGARVAATAAANSQSVLSSSARAASHGGGGAFGGGDHLCTLGALMAWNWPIGRHCSRIFAYAAAVSVAQRAMPTASADRAW